MLKNGGDWEELENSLGKQKEGVLRSVKAAGGKHQASFTLQLPATALTVVFFFGVVAVVYLRVTAEGCGDNGQALNDALEAPQVDPLHPGAWD